MNSPVGRTNCLLALGALFIWQSSSRVLAAGMVQPLIEPGHIHGFRETLRDITLRQELLGYIVDIVRATRGSDMVLVGAGPRATQAFVLAGRARAALEGRDFVTPDDIKALAVPILGHRLILRPEHEIEGVTVPEVIERILGEIRVPR